jgi:anti-sigma factor RsiW
MENNHARPEVLSAMADGEVSVDESARVTAHMTVCSTCRAAFASIQNNKNILAQAKRVPMPRDLMARLEARFTAAPRKNRWVELFSRPLFWAPAGVGAAVAVVLLMTSSAKESIPLEVLMASHARYQEENLAPGADLHQAYFTAHVAGEIERE